MATEAARVHDARDAPATPSTRPSPPAVAPRRRFTPRHAAGAMTSALARLVWSVVAIVDAILVLDFVFRLIGAKDEGFVHAVFVFGSTLASPFNGIFASVAHQFPYTLTWSDLVALALCTIAGWLMVRLIRAAGPRRKQLA
jgi:flagellar biogenesis protein FliO